MSNTAAALKFPIANLGPDATDAAWRIAGAQLVKLTREPLVAALSRNLGPGDEALRARIAMFLDTELGTAMVTAVLSIALSAMPAIPLPGAGANAVPRLAQELRVKAMADAADFAADLFMGPLRESLSMFILTAGVQQASLGDGERLNAQSASPSWSTSPV
ncbi:MAG: hypothetical protein U0326_41325 [Polyangiales bacterium]